MEDVKYGKKTASENAEPIDHPDLQSNRYYVDDFIANVTPKLLKGLRVWLGSSSHRNGDLLWISYRPPIGVRMGDFAVPISLNQPKKELERQIEYWFNAYHLMAKQVHEREEKKYEQVNFLKGAA